jgi:hypothetical protein
MKHFLSLIGGAMVGLVLAQCGPALAVDTATSILCTDPAIPITLRLVIAKQGYPDPGNCYAYPPAGRAAYQAFGSTPATLVTGRSVAGQIGIYCATPAKTCELYHASYVGGGCSCRVPGGRSRGFVSP